MGTPKNSQAASRTFVGVHKLGAKNEAVARMPDARATGSKSREPQLPVTVTFPVVRTGMQSVVFSPHVVGRVLAVIFRKPWL